MNEIRIRPRNLALLLGGVVFLMLLMLRSGGGNECLSNGQAAGRRGVQRKADAPIIYAITPTYARPVQKAELTRYYYYQFIIPETTLPVHVYWENHLVC